MFVRRDHPKCRLTPRGSAAGEVPAPSEFYGPLPATGGPHRAESGRPAPASCNRWLGRPSGRLVLRDLDIEVHGTGSPKQVCWQAVTLNGDPTRADALEDPEVQNTVIN